MKEFERKIEEAKEFKTKVVEVQDVRHETSSGCSETKKREMTYAIELGKIEIDGYGDETRYGSFEVYSDCGEYHAEGGLWFALCEDGWELVDYDGIFDLPDTIKDQLKKWGFIPIGAK